MVLVAAALAFGCGGRQTVASDDPMAAGNWQQRISAGFTGCLPGEIVLEGFYEDVVESWVAVCHGRRHVCAWVRGANGQCTPMDQASGGAPPLMPMP